MKVRNKKILVTGAGGFIGSHLVEQLVMAGADVKAFVHYNSRGHWGWLDYSPIKSQIQVVVGDISDYDSVKSAIRDVDVVFHLAALIGIPYSYVSPLAYVRTNINGTYNVLQAARELETGRVVITSSSEVYGTARYVPINEIHPLQPLSPYSASKIGADNLALSYFHAFNLPVIVARPFNTYGPRQSARAIIPAIITQILSGRRALELGNLTPTRDLNFVSDTVAGLMAIAECDQALGEVINIGTGREIAVSDLVQMIAKLLEADIDVGQSEQRIRPKTSEVERLLCDNVKISAMTSWMPHIPLEDGLKRTIEWLRVNMAQYKPDTYSV